jgi:hypothetical protein
LGLAITDTANHATMRHPLLPVFKAPTRSGGPDWGSASQTTFYGLDLRKCDPVHAPRLAKVPEATGFKSVADSLHVEVLKDPVDRGRDVLLELGPEVVVEVGEPIAQVLDAFGKGVGGEDLLLKELVLVSAGLDVLGVVFRGIWGVMGRVVHVLYMN